MNGDDMKKFILFGVCILFLLTGCQLDNTPTSQVEAFLTKYQMLDEDISVDYVSLSNEVVSDVELQRKYQKLIQKQYKSLSYEVKEEEIDGEEAEVTVEIEVFNYGDVIQKYNAANYEETTYHQKVVQDLERVKEKVTYTIDFEVVQNQNGEWGVTPIDSEESQKLLGIYSK